jgi:hypothetical protein
MSVGLYVGSRHDIIPLLLFPEITRWVYMDSLPVYNAGFEEDKYPKDQKKEMYFADVEKELSKAGFSLDTRNDHEKLLLFKQGKQEVYFFHSTFFPTCSMLQKQLLKEVNYMYLSAYCPDRIVLDMVCKTKPLTLLIWHVPLFYNWEQGNYTVDFQKDRKLTTFLLFNYVENVNYIYLNDKNTMNQKSLRLQIMNHKINKFSVEKIPCINLLEYHQKELRNESKHFKTLKDIPVSNYKNVSVKNRKN